MVASSTFGWGRYSKLVGVAAAVAAAAAAAEPPPGRLPGEGEEEEEDEEEEEEEEEEEGEEEGILFDSRCALDMKTDMRGRVRPEVTSFFTLMAPPGGASWVTRSASPCDRSGHGTGATGLQPGTASAVVPQPATAGVASNL